MRFIYTGAFRFPNFDAASQRVLNNARILRELGHEVVFIAYGGIIDSEAQSSDGYGTYDGFKYLVTDELLSTKNIFQRFLQQVNRGKIANNVINRDYSDWNVIEYNSYFTRGWSDITEWYDTSDFAGGYLSYGFWRSEYNLKIKQKLVPKKILISSFLDQYYRDSDNIIIPPLINIDDCKWSMELSRIPMTISSHKGRRIIFAGTPAKKDLLSNVISALCHLVVNGDRSVQLIILGVDPNNMYKYCSREQLNLLKDNIVIVGRVPQDSVPAYYKLADFSLIIREPTKKNMAGFPTKMAESMAAGCPVLMTPTSDLERYVQNGVQGILIPDTRIDSIVSGLKTISNLSNDRIQEMKFRAKSLALTKFDWRNYISPMQDFIGSCV
ncbi:MAG: glycosyltransferase family 4 protein [Bacteroidales bacterium]|nr:glycosyltransferase family 4 protein [Bacteroidales bacterium]